MFPAYLTKSQQSVKDEEFSSLKLPKVGSHIITTQNTTPKTRSAKLNLPELGAMSSGHRTAILSVPSTPVSPSIPIPTLQRLTISNLDEIIKLQEVTCQKLRLEGKSKFLYKKSKEEFESLLSSKNNFILGYYSDGKLIAQLVIKELASNEKSEGSDYHINAETGKSLGITDNVVRYSIGGLIVDPDQRNNGLAHRLIGDAEKFLSKQHISKDICLSAISSTENPGSFLSFMSNDYAIISKFVSQEDGDTDYLLHKPLNRQLSSTLRAMPDVPLPHLKSSSNIKELDNIPAGKCLARSRDKQFYIKNIASIALSRNDKQLGLGC